MNIPICFFISLILAVFGFIIAAFNICTATKRMFSDEFKSIYVVHIIAMLFYGLGGIGAVCFGIAWIVTYLKN